MASLSVPFSTKLYPSPHFRSADSSPSLRCKPYGFAPRRTLRQAVSSPQSSIADLPNADLVSSLKLKLLTAVSGLDRGLAATAEDLQNADSAARDLEAAAGPVDLSVDLDKLQGRWKLIYSSAFSSRTITAPLTLGRVFQRIDVLSKDYDNIVEIEIGAPWPLQPIELTEVLAHKFEVIG